MKGGNRSQQYLLEAPSVPKPKKINFVSPRAPESKSTARRQRLKENLPKQPSFEPIVTKMPIRYPQTKVSAPPKLSKLAMSKIPSADILAKRKSPPTSPMLKKI